VSASILLQQLAAEQRLAAERDVEAVEDYCEAAAQAEDG
jgi:hypothetical protein